MSIGAISSISAAGLGQSVFQAGNGNQLQQTLQTLQNTLASGDLSGAQSAFQTLQSIFQNSATASGRVGSSNSQLSTDLNTLGSALSSGNVSSAQSAFATVLSDLKTTALPSQINEAAAASQSVQSIEELLSSLNASASSSDPTASILQSVYGSQSGLSVYG
jgi:phosphoenolpyruvate carboxylase